MISRVFRLFGVVLLFVFGAEIVAGAKVIVNTTDGLPLEVELLGFHRDEVKIRILASGRETSFFFSKLNKRSQKIISDWAEPKRRDFASLSFSVKLEENHSAKTIILTQPHCLSRQEFDKKEFRKLLKPGGRALRLRGASVSPADIPVEVYVYWFAKKEGVSAWEIAIEKAEVEATFVSSDYITKPSPFPRATYQGFAVFIVEVEKKNIIWRNASRDTFLREAEKRFAV
ncbi:MAG: hypothetical protein LBS59_01275, partial [Puniceicoccales bacterium]|nr:hypothetical protein [Puniceicoccales bacterium]